MKAVLIGLGMVADTHLAALHASQTVDLHGVLGRRRETTDAFAEKASTLLGRDMTRVHLPAVSVALKQIFLTAEPVAFEPQVNQLTELHETYRHEPCAHVFKRSLV